MHEYAGTWSEYEAARERARAQHERDYANYVDEKGRYTALLRDRRTQAQQLGGPRKLARQTGGSDRRATNALRGKVQQAKNHLERLEEVEKPWSPWRLRLDLPAGPPTGADRRARGRRRRTRLVLARAGLARAALGRAARDRRPERLRQDDADRRAARRPAARARRPPARPGRRLRRAEPGPRPFTGVLLDDFVEASGLRPPTHARCSRSSRSARTTSAVRRHACRRASARGPAWRCSPRAVSTASCSTSRRTTSTSRRSRSSRRHSRRSRAASSSSRTTVASSSGCA